MRGRWLALCALCWACASGAATPAPHTLRVANYLPPMSVAVSKIMEPWLEELEQASGGQLQFERYYGGALGRGPHRQYLLLESGVADISYIFLPMHSGRFRDVEILEIPGMVSSGEQASVLGWQLFEQGLLSGFEQVKVLAIFATEPGRLFTRQQISEPADYRGLKIRAAGQVQGNYVSSLGASPEVMDAATATEALRRGTIDGLIQGWSGLAIFRQGDMVDHFVDAPVGVLSFALLMNKERFDKLPAELQALINKHSGLALSRAAGRSYDQVGHGFANGFIESGAVLPQLPRGELQQELSAGRQLTRENWVGQDQRRQQLVIEAQRLIEENP
jgi:TRAP-type transport system periplasmic protein